MEMVKECIMKKKFEKPDFSTGSIELRYENDEINIYASRIGLERLIDYCKVLLDNPQKGHIHLEDYNILTSDSLIGTLAIFEE